MHPSPTLIATAPTLASDLGTLGVVMLASIASGATAIPAARALGIHGLYARRRPDPELAAATLIACASVARQPGFNPQASAGDEPLMARAITLLASDLSPEEVSMALTADPPIAPRPVIAWAPVVGLLICLAGLAAIIAAMSQEALVGPPIAIALLIALFAAFFVSAAAGALDDRAHRLDPADILTRALISAAVPAIRAGADAAAVERILRPFLPPAHEEPVAGRLAA